MALLGLGWKVAARAGRVDIGVVNAEGLVRMAGVLRIVDC